MQQVSDYELELMKAIWGNGGTALYARIVEALSGKGMDWTKNTIITLLSRLVDEGVSENRQDRAAESIYGAGVGGRIPDRADGAFRE